MAKKSTKATSGSLTDDILGIIKDEEIGDSNNIECRYETGIKMFDFRNGRLDEEGNLSLGIDGGKIFTIIGKPGSGKTTFGIMATLNIISKYKDAQFIHLDYENATPKSRVYSIAKMLGIQKEEIKEKYIYLNKEIYTESLYKLTKAVAKLKMEKYDSIKIDTGKVDDEGNPLYVLPPTVMLVDSWASVIPKNISEEEELSGQDNRLVA